MYEIEPGIEMPPKVWGCPGGSKYPFKNMEVSDSFFVAANGADIKKLGNSIITAARYHGKPHNMRFTTRSVVENDIPGVRCWRFE